MINNNTSVQDFTKRTFKTSYSTKLGDQGKSQSCTNVCNSCTEPYVYGLKAKVKSMQFGISVV